MSTDLYGIRILKKNNKEKKIQIKVFVVYYDVQYKRHQPIPKDYSFFFGILTDSFFAPRLTSSPIAAEVSDDLLRDEHWINKNTFKYIERVEKLSTANFPVTDYSGYHDFYYVQEGAWVNEDKLVQAVYDVYVSDEKYISHLEKGMSWGTTSYETNAALIDKNHRQHLPDLSRLIIQLIPFQDKEQEQGTIASARFSNDNTKLFVLSEAGELVAYHTENWEEAWRYDTDDWFGKIECDNIKNLVWVTNKTVLHFEGKVVDINVYPDFQGDTKYAKIYRSPSGNYFLCSFENEKIVIYDKLGHHLWEYSGEEEGCCMYTSFFNLTEQLLVREEEMGIFKTFELNTGAVTNRFELDMFMSNMNLHPADAYLSFSESHTEASRIVDLKKLQSVFNFSTNKYNGDYLQACIWSSNQKFGLIVTKGEGQRRNNGYGGYLSIYAVGD